MSDPAFLNPRSVEEKILIQIPSQNSDIRDIPLTLVYDEAGDVQTVKFSAKTQFNREDLQFMADNFEQIRTKGLPISITKMVSDIKTVVGA